VALEFTVEREDDRVTLRGVARIAVRERDVDRSPLAEDLRSAEVACSEARPQTQRFFSTVESDEK